MPDYTFYQFGVHKPYDQLTPAEKEEFHKKLKASIDRKAQKKLEEYKKAKASNTASPEQQPEPEEPEEPQRPYEPDWTFASEHRHEPVVDEPVDGNPINVDPAFAPLDNQSNNLPPSEPPPPPPKYKGLNKPDIDQISQKLNVSPEEISALLAFTPDFEQRNKVAVFLVGVLFTPVTLIGALLGYVRGYNRLMRPYKLLPNFWPLRPAVRIAMITCSIASWLILGVLCLVYFSVTGSKAYWLYLLAFYLTANTMFSLIVYLVFKRWRIGVNNVVVESEKFGTARFATVKDTLAYTKQSGIYIGGGHYYNKQGHILTCAGSRSGKFTNIIAPNLLGWGNIDGSYLVIDPKAEIAAVTSAYQQETGREVVILNPWGLLEERLPQAMSYNPMDILDINNAHMVDDVQMLAEMLVPVDKDPKNRFFTDSARTIISGLILYIAVSETGEARSLTTLWKWVRYNQELWDRIIAEMENAEDLPFAENLLYAAGEIQRLAKSGGNTWGSILSSVLQSTDFLKSGALQKSLQTGFDPKRLAAGNVTLYVVIPADKLQSHSRWLRLVTTSMMRAVIRKPNKRVVFLLDEFAALGYLPEIEIALGAYAGFNVTVWPIVQSLVQLKNLYGDNWEVFIGNTAVRQYFGIHNNFDAEYISKAIGKKSHVMTTRKWFGVDDAQANERQLITPDELRIESGRKIFTFIAELPPAMFDKLPYHEVKQLNDRAEKNPYHNNL